MMDNSQIPPSTELLPHNVLNPQGETTVLFIHGAFGDQRDWDLVTPHLEEYHLILPDLPGHGQATSFPFSLDEAVLALRALIVHRAHGGVSHIVGFSLGAKIAVHLVARFPELVQDRAVFISGFGVIPATTLTAYLPSAVWLITRIEWLIPRVVVRWLLDGADMRRADLSKVTIPLCREIFAPARDEADEWPRPWAAPTLIVAAGKKGILPTADNADNARRLASIGRRANYETIAVTHAELRHPWCRQKPDLFAQTVAAWLEKTDILTGFVRLSRT